MLYGIAFVAVSKLGDRKTFKNLSAAAKLVACRCVRSSCAVSVKRCVRLLCAGCFKRVNWRDLTCTLCGGGCAPPGGLDGCGALPLLCSDLATAAISVFVAIMAAQG